MQIESLPAYFSRLCKNWCLHLFSFPTGNGNANESLPAYPPVQARVVGAIPQSASLTAPFTQR